MRLKNKEYDRIRRAEHKSDPLLFTKLSEKGRLNTPIESTCNKNPNCFPATFQATADGFVAEIKGFEHIWSVIEILRQEYTGINVFSIDEDFLCRANTMLAKELEPFLIRSKVHKTVYTYAHKIPDFHSFSCFKCNI